VWSRTLPRLVSGSDSQFDWSKHHPQSTGSRISGLQWTQEGRVVNWVKPRDAHTEGHHPPAANHATLMSQLGQPYAALHSHTPMPPEFNPTHLPLGALGSAPQSLLDRHKPPPNAVLHSSPVRPHIHAHTHTHTRIRTVNSFEGVWTHQPQCSVHTCTPTCKYTDQTCTFQRHGHQEWNHIPCRLNRGRPQRRCCTRIQWSYSRGR
jgi:hypothetical protein